MLKNIAVPPAICSNPPLVRDKPLGAPAFVRFAYSVLFVHERIDDKSGIALVPSERHVITQTD